MWSVTKNLEIFFFCAVVLLGVIMIEKLNSLFIICLYNRTLNKTKTPQCCWSYGFPENERSQSQIYKSVGILHVMYSVYIMYNKIWIRFLLFVYIYDGECTSLVLYYLCWRCCPPCISKMFLFYTRIYNSISIEK